MSYTVRVLRGARKDVESLPIELRRRLYQALHALADDPRPPGCMKLSGRQGWRIRVGDYRILYDIDDRERTVTVARIRHRGEAYR
jgi:mRNA interferase RelE/StbE